MHSRLCTWVMLIKSFVSDGSARLPTETVDEMLRSWKRTSVVDRGTPALPSHVAGPFSEHECAVS